MFVFSVFIVFYYTMFLMGILDTHFLQGGAGGGGRGSLHDLKNGTIYKFQIWQAIRTIFERLKNVKIDDQGLIIFPWQLINLTVLFNQFC